MNREQFKQLAIAYRDPLYTLALLLGCICLLAITVVVVVGADRTLSLFASNPTRNPATVRFGSIRELAYDNIGQPGPGQFPDLIYVGISKFRHTMAHADRTAFGMLIESMRGTSSVTSLLLTIPNVVPGVSQKQMGGITARTNIAFMKSKLVRPDGYSEKISKTMCPDPLTCLAWSNREYAVSSIVDKSMPEPTFFRTCLVDLRPESNNMLVGQIGWSRIRLSHLRDLLIRLQIWSEPSLRYNALAAC